MADKTEPAVVRDNGRVKLDRRGMLGMLAIGAAAASAGANASAVTPEPTAKRKARYQGDAPEVQTFYRVNSYPPKRK